VCSLSILCTGCACQLIIKENDDDDDDDTMWLTCWWNFRQSSTNTPRSLTWSTMGRAETPMSKLGPITGLVLPLRMCMTAHVLTDILSCHSLHHFSTDFNLSSKPLPSSFTSRVAYILTSSANSLHTQLPSLNISMITLMNSTNSNGPIALYNTATYF